MVTPGPNELGRSFLSGLKLNWIRRPVQIQESEPPGNEIPIEEWREAMHDARIQSLGEPGLYLDRSPTGAGKTTADIAALREAGGGLVVVQTHAQARELETELLMSGIKARAFPRRSSTGDEANCWNEDADRVQSAGLPVSSALCPHCEFRQRCDKSGYLAQLKQVDAAEVKIETHQRRLSPENHPIARSFRGP